MELKEYNELRASKERIDAMVNTLDAIVEVLESMLNELPSSVLAIRAHKLNQVRKVRELLRVMKLSG